MRPTLLASAKCALHLVLLCGATLSAFDEYSSSCMRPGGRAAKAWPDPPCDFSNQAWCTAPGSAYPWHAVRRFVQENQGLMRRMYGEMRQISVMRAEFESNDLYPGDGIDFQLIRDGVTKRYRPINEIPSTSPRSRPTSTSTVRSTTTTTTTTKKPTKATARPTSKLTTTPSTTTTTASTTTTTTKATTTTTTTTSTSTVPSTTKLAAPLARNVSFTSVPVPSTTAASSTTPEEMDLPDGSTTLAPDTTSVSEQAVEAAALVLEKLGEEAVESQQSVPEDQEAEETDMEGEDDEEGDEEEYDDDAYEEEESQKDQSITKGPQVLRRGVNACPVKEEVVAPFWANNTRGEILALLNLYPFEQYVHWEKCTDEHQQMFCRDGCRCEQQYRLHRLLAYDPRNECRGIFSDWFKFPSCCVCKCYDIPPEFRLTSRSPRRKTKRKPGAKKPTGLEPKLRQPIYINGLDRRVEGGGEIREDLKAIVHRAREGRDFPETATIGTVDAATPHFYYQPPGGLVHLSRRPRDTD